MSNFYIWMKTIRRGYGYVLDTCEHFVRFKNATVEVKRALGPEAWMTPFDFGPLIIFGVWVSDQVVDELKYEISDRVVFTEIYSDFSLLICFRPGGTRIKVRVLCLHTRSSSVIQGQEEALGPSWLWKISSTCTPDVMHPDRRKLSVSIKATARNGRILFPAVNGDEGRYLTSNGGP